MIPSLRMAYADVVVVLITAPPDVLAARLASRGRSSDGPVGELLRRDVGDAAPEVTIQNVGPAEHHANEFVRAIRG
jgi:ribose 1,5-bisphosphokinase